MTLKEKECEQLINIGFDSRGHFKRFGYKTFKGLVRELEKMNKNCKRLGFVTEIRIKLPILK